MSRILIELVTCEEFQYELNMDKKIKGDGIKEVFRVVWIILNRFSTEYERIKMS